VTTAEPTGATAGPIAADEPRRRSERTEFWTRTRRGWDLAFYALIGITAVSLVTVRGTTTTGLLWGLGGLALLVVAYATAGRRAALTGNRDLVALYLSVLVAVTVLVTYTNATGSLLLFVAYSQVWYFVETRRGGVVVSAVLTVLLFGAIVLREEVGPGDGLVNLASQAAVALAFSTLLGLWITYVAEQSEQRAELLEQLEDAQAQLAEVHHAAGVVAERERMAREIHDTLAQGFTSVIMLTQTAVADLRRDDPQAAVARLELAERTARDNLAEARALVAAFSPVDLDGVTVTGALERLAHRFQQETGVAVEVVLPDTELRVARDTEVVLLRTAQEALTNVRRHARARHVRLRLAEVADDAAGAGGSVVLEVVDDGAGIPADAAEGFGLRGMRDRVAAEGGRVDVTSPAEGGTALTVRVPLAGRMDA
jgi:signal transduction histidine kinase